MPATRALASEAVAAFATFGNLSLSTARTASLSFFAAAGGGVVSAGRDFAHAAIATMVAAIDKHSNRTRRNCITCAIGSRPRIGVRTGVHEVVRGYLRGLRSPRIGQL